MDERIESLRDRIDAVDRRLVGDVNERLRLVGELWHVKAELGIDPVDPGREEALRAALRDENGGPLTGDGLEELVTEILALTKREQDRHSPLGG